MDTDPKIARMTNPRARTNPVSAVLFLHMFPIFWRFYKTEMKEEDLFDVLDEHKSSKLGERLEILWSEEHQKHKKAALHIALLRQFGLELAIAGSLIAVAEITLIIVTPLAIGNLVTYFQNGPANGNIEDGYYYALLVCGALASRIIISHPCLMWMSHICMKMRVACCSLIYRKSLRLSAAALSQTTIGQIVNLLSNDVSKFDQGFIYWHHFFIAPVQAAIGTYLLYRAIGAAAFSGVAFMVMFVPIQLLLGKANSKMRLKTAIRTDERLRLMNEILTGINVIKMYTWELPFSKLVSKSRRFEIKATRAHFYIQAVFYSLQIFVTRTSIFITLMVFISLGNTVSAGMVYSITAVYSILRPVLTAIYSVAIAALADVHISVSRIQTFLSYEEIKPYVQFENDIKISSNNDNRAENIIMDKLQSFAASRISLEHIDIKWVKDLPDYALKDINLNIDCNQLVAVIGPVGSGKSTLLNVLLKELPVTNGNLLVNGKISYASQEPWLFSGTVRQNILFGDEYNEARYKTVLNICALETDLNLFPYGDHTIISESGKSLSGGQKARINLARCIYRRADIYLLDDPLSAVDTNVGKHLYENCIRHYLKDKICILITHQLQYLSSVDKIVILTNGRISGEGTYRELQDSGLDFAILLKEFNAGFDQEQDTTETVVTKRNSIIEESCKDDTDYKETTASGSVTFKTYAQYFKAGGGYFLMACLLLAFIFAHTVGNLGDYFVAYWVNLEQSTVKEAGASSHTYANSFLNRDIVIYIYSTIIIFTIIAAVGHCMFFFVFVTRASVNMHNLIFERITFATMRFFNLTPTGRILNRFSKDIGTVDEYIPIVLMDTIGAVFVLIAATIISVSVNPWLFLPVLILVFIYYWLRVFYIATSRSVKRIEGIVRSPIFNHISATISGLSTVRAFTAQSVLMKEFDTHQDLHSSAWYLFFAASRTFGYWLDVTSITFIAIVIFYLVGVNNNYQGGEVGLIVTQYILLSTIIQWGMRQWSELENNIISVERVFEYTKVDTEPIRKLNQNVPNDWPQAGELIFQNVSMRYIVNGPTVLKNLNITINPREKIGIVGRTGAGKTSIISALFQLYETEGCIILDGIDITKLPLKVLRSKISIIPQEPVLFSGTLRNNLDPLEEYSDDMLWNALEQVELKKIVEAAVGGLSTPVSEAGSNYSIGQRQLICLARAIIRNNKVLVLDEATANVDPHTDSVIQKTIRCAFSQCTVLTIAHRLHTIMDSDKVIVMDSGAMVEFDHPFNLLQKSNGLFYDMVHTTGKGATKNLYLIAEENFAKRR